MSIKIPLREQDVTHKPRVTKRDDGLFQIDYIGAITKAHCGTLHRTFKSAIEAANRRAIQNARMMRRFPNA